VNVHPAKREVRFRSEALVRGFILRAVLSRLREFAGQEAPAGRAPPSAALGFPARLPAPFRGWAGEAAQEAVSAGPAPAASPRGSGSPSPAEIAPPWRFVGTAHGSYALFETAHGLVLLDRRAAHERVWYERLRGQFREGGVPVQRLLLPVSVELNPVASAVLIDNLAFIRAHGLEISDFGRNFFRVEAVPAWMEPGDADGFIRDLVGALREGRMPVSDIDLARDEFARLAAAKAIRLPQTSGEAETLALLRELFATSSPVSAPTGRPTYVELNHGELARRFQK
jgi:DNA mismatch repair protein MutL